MKNLLTLNLNQNEKNLLLLINYPTIVFSLIYSCGRDKAIENSSSNTDNIFSKNE